MKKYYTKHFFLIVGIIYNVSILSAQSTEIFETESAGFTIFFDNGQSFNISSASAEGYDIFTHGYTSGTNTDTCLGCGWNGSSPDNKFVDNAGANNGSNNGTSMEISTSDGAYFTISSLYLFCSTLSLSNTTGTLILSGMRNGIEMFSITKSSGFASPVTFSPNNGYTYIDFATEGVSDYSDTAIDEIIISGTGDLDYMALDAFSWSISTLSSKSNAFTQSVKIFPNPTLKNITIAFDRVYEKININVVNITGQLVNTFKKLNVSRFNFNINSPPGVYFVEIKSSQGEKSIFKLIKN